MELRRDILLPVFVSIALVVLTSFGTIALLTRMAPAIERILKENVYSLEATEKMLELVSSRSTDADIDFVAQFAEALARAENNITEKLERPHVAVIRARWRPMLAGDDAARDEVTSALVELGAINRAAMAKADDTAQRMGYAGAWAAVLLGVIAFAWGLLVARRARRRIFEPLNEIVDVLRHHDRGERFRRCQMMAAPTELMHMMETLNALLDERDQLARQQRVENSPEDRAVLLHLLDRQEGPAFVITETGAVEAANSQGLDALSGADSVRVRGVLADCARGEPPDGTRCDPIERASRWLCEL